MKFTDKVFFYLTFFIILLFFVLIGLFNYSIDYENIFSKKNIRTQELKKISENINKGVSELNNYNHRDIKRALALFSINDDCFILGSSQHILIRSEYLTNLDPKCKNNTNLSLPGGSLEDILISTYFTSIREKKIKKVFLGIGPYTFKYNSDYQLRWKKFESVFIKMNDKKVLKKKNNYEIFKEYLRILYDKKLFMKNFEYLKNLIFEPKNNVNQKNIIIKKDGSYEFIGKYQLKKGEFLNKVENARWGFNDLYFEESPKKSLINNIKFLQSKGIEVDILLVPFHPFVFSSKDWIVPKIYKANNELKKIAQELNVNIYGSFFPDDLGCSKYDFYDDSHPKKTCLKKIMR